MDNTTLQRANYLTKSIEDIERIERMYKDHEKKYFIEHYFALRTPNPHGSSYKDVLVEIPREANNAILYTLSECKKLFKKELDQL